MDLKWRTLGGRSIADISEEVENTIIREIAEGNKIKVCIGCDSQMHGVDCQFATAVDFIREKRGGLIFVARENDHQYHGKIKQRMLDEVSRAIGTAYKLCDLLDRYDIPMEVHADINQSPNFESNVALKEAMGYILGMGFEFKAKPDAFASSSCANKVVQ